MQVKVCPKCKAQNRPTSAACSNCYSSLEGVQVTEGTAPPVAASTAPAAPRPARSAAAPTQQMGVPTQTMAAPQQTQMGVPAQTQMGQMSPPPGRPMPPGAYQTHPQPKRAPVGIIVVVILVVCAALGVMVFAVSRSGFFKPDPPPTESPEKAMLAFLEAKKTEDMAKCQPYLSEYSVYTIQHALSSKQAQSAGFTHKDAADMLLWSMPPTREELGGDKEIIATEMKGDRDASDRIAIVHVVVDFKAEPAAAPRPLLPPDQTPPPEPDKKMDFVKSLHLGKVDIQYVMRAEQGKWKVDIDDTHRRALGLGPRESFFKIGK